MLVMGLRASIFVGLAALLAGCNSLHQVSAQEFIELAGQGPATMSDTAYIGYTRGAHESKARVYLQVWRRGLLSSGTEVYWAPLAEFSTEMKVAILAGRDPFAPRERGTERNGR